MKVAELPSYTPMLVEHLNPGFVLQSWTANVGLKMQSILLSGLRAPDSQTRAVKKLVRWMRARCQIDADPKKQSYMESVALSDELIDEAIDELEYLTCHYVHHLADSVVVIAYFHPIGGVRALAYSVHFLIAEELFHFKPETQDEFLRRHQDAL